MVNPESVYFSEIRRSVALGIFLAGFSRCQCSCSTQYVQLITDKTNAADLYGGNFS